MNCPVCDREMDAADAVNLSTPIHECLDCDLFCRPVDRNSLDSQFASASYTRIENERHFFAQRVGFFRYVLSKIETLPDMPVTKSGKPDLLDFGCAYGHLMDVAAEHGIRAVGVERSDKLRAFCAERGLAVESSLQALSKRIASGVSAGAGIAALIDSLYYVEQPLNLLDDLKDVLLPGAWVVARLTNRNSGVRFRNRFSRQNDFGLLGDAVVSYSPKAARRLFDRAGFHVRMIEPDTGRGKQLPLKKTILYSVTGPISALLPESAMLTPGYLLYAQLPSSS